MSKLIRLLKSQKKEDISREEESQVKCSICEKREATGSDGLCNHCRFDDVLKQMQIVRK